MLFVSLAFLREKYLRYGDGDEKTERFLTTICPSAAGTNDPADPALCFTIPRLRELVTEEGRAQLAAAFEDIPQVPGVADELAQNVDDMLGRWDTSVMSEGSQFNLDGETAFTLDQGAGMVYCLRKKRRDGEEFLPE